MLTASWRERGTDRANSLPATSGKRASWRTNRSSRTATRAGSRMSHSTVSGSVAVVVVLVDGAQHVALAHELGAEAAVDPDAVQHHALEHEQADPVVGRGSRDPPRRRRGP